LKKWESGNVGRVLGTLHPLPIDFPDLRDDERAGLYTLPTSSRDEVRSEGSVGELAFDAVGMDDLSPIPVHHTLVQGTAFSVIADGLAFALLLLLISFRQGSRLLDSSWGRFVGSICWCVGLLEISQKPFRMNLLLTVGCDTGSWFQRSKPKYSGDGASGVTGESPGVGDEG
jgi:hypothetical protein